MCMLKSVCVHVYISMRACRNWGEGEGEKGVTGLKPATNI